MPPYMRERDAEPHLYATHEPHAGAARSLRERCAPLYRTLYCEPVRKAGPLLRYPAPRSIERGTAPLLRTPP